VGQRAAPRTAGRPERGRDTCGSEGRSPPRQALPQALATRRACCRKARRRCPSSPIPGSLAVVTRGRYMRPLHAAVTRGRYARPLHAIVTRDRHTRSLHAVVTRGRRTPSFPCVVTRGRYTQSSHAVVTHGEGGGRGGKKAAVAAEASDAAFDGEIWRDMARYGEIHRRLWLRWWRFRRHRRFRRCRRFRRRVRRRRRRRGGGGSVTVGVVRGHGGLHRLWCGGACSPGGSTGARRPWHP
jgi:hypothetical protein